MNNGYKTSIETIIYYTKFLIYGLMSIYDYSIGSKWTFAWLLLALSMLSFAVISEIKSYIDYKFKNQSL